MEIDRLSEQNPWWSDEKSIEEDDKVKEADGKKRKIRYDFEEKNTLIIGPRQVGKTTFLKLFIRHLIGSGIDPKRIIYFSCETVRDFNEIVEIVRFSDSLTKGEKYIFFDEITFVDGWQRAVKFVLDSPLGKRKKLFITGSSSIALKKETFPGRPLRTKEFLPLSFREFCEVFGSESLKKELKARISKISADEIAEKSKRLFFFFNDIQRLFESYIISGGFPRSAYELMENEKIKDETYEIYWKWLVADIAKIERSERIARSVIMGVLKNYGTRFSLNSISKETEIGSHVTVREYLELLENLFMLRNIFPAEMRRGTESFRKMRKVYLIDPFLFHSFRKQIIRAGISEEEIPRLIEGVVAEHLARKFGKIFYYHQKKEIDFYIEGSGIELKWQKNVRKSDFPKTDLKNKILLSRNQFEFPEDNIAIVPAAIFLLLL